MFIIKTESVSETEELGKSLGQVFSANDIVLINGELGAGKTSLIRGIVEGAGGNFRDVRSPSYTYLNIYQADFQVYHLDVYLLDNYEDLFEIGIEELWGKGLMLIEWGGRFASEMTLPYWQIDIKYDGQEYHRHFTITSPQAKTDILEEVRQKWQY